MTELNLKALSTGTIWKLPRPDTIYHAASILSFYLFNFFINPCKSIKKYNNVWHSLKFFFFTFYHIEWLIHEILIKLYGNLPYHPNLKYRTHLSSLILLEESAATLLTVKFFVG